MLIYEDDTRPNYPTKPSLLVKLDQEKVAQVIAITLYGDNIRWEECMPGAQKFIALYRALSQNVSSETSRNGRPRR
jgi:hypothetical protein